MIFTASYFESQNHHGKIISISRSVPKGIKVAGDLRFLMPSANLLHLWKQDPNEVEYTRIYREEIKSHWKEIRKYLDELNPGVDETLCCWERTGLFCHRNLAIKLVEHHRPDCFGGKDKVIEPSEVQQSLI